MGSPFNSSHKIESGAIALSIVDDGFTILSTGGISPLLDIVIVHGLQGHPKKTWTTSKVKRTRWPHGLKASSEDYYVDVYWPLDLLPESIPNARILVYGYDSKVSRFFKGAANQNSLVAHAKNLLNDLVRIRDQSPARPLVFISHSLGGILVKEVLRRSEPGRQVEDFTGYEAISRSLCGIIFMGTPHRGGNYGSLGKAVERAVKHLGFDTNDAVLRELHENSQVLEIVHEEFMRLLERRSPFLTVYTFLEAKGLTGLQGFSAKVVDDSSAILQHRYEIVQFINQNHRDMCRFGGKYDDGYARLVYALHKYCEKIKSVPLRTPDNVVSMIPFPRNPSFVGRTSEMDILSRSLFKRPDTFSEAAVVGLGGVGKTQIALEFAYHLHDQANPESPLSVYWIHASSQSRLEEGLRHIEKNLWLMKVMRKETKDPHPISMREEQAEDALSLVKEWLESPYSKTWLLVIDNADDEDVFFSSIDPSKTQRHHASPPPTLLERTSSRRFCDYIPRKAGCAILYTSRHRNCVQHLLSQSQDSTIIPVSPLNVNESVAMLERDIEQLFDEQKLEEARLSTERLAKVLDGLPLAIKQATTFMMENQLDPRTYLELYEEMGAHQASFLEEEFVDWRRDSDVPNAVLLNWKIAYDQVKRKDPIAARVLCLLSLLDRSGVPDWMLRFLPDINPLQRTKALGLLRSFFFIQNGNRMHRLLQISARAWMEPETRKDAIQQALRLLSYSFYDLGFAKADADWSHNSGKAKVLSRSLDYYPHAHSLLAFISGNDSTRTAQEVLRHHSVQDEQDPLASNFFARRAYSMYEKIVDGDYHTLQSEMENFVELLDGGSSMSFSYHDLIPKFYGPGESEII